MNLKLRVVDEEREAQALLPLLTTAAQASNSALRDEPIQPEAVGRLLEQTFGRSESLLLLAEKEDVDAPCALLLTAPLIDPLDGRGLPLIVALWVDPDLRHRGLARAVVAEARRILRLRGHDEVAARVPYNDDALLSMGERWGFVRSWEFLSA